MNSPKSAIRLELQKHILPIVVTFPDGTVDCIGTGFVTFTNGRSAHLVTAAHVIDQIRRIDNPHPKHHPSTPSIFLPIIHRAELQRAKPRAIYFDGETAHVAAIEAAMEMSKYDTALCSIRFSDSVNPRVVFNSRLGLDTTPVAVGEQIIAIGYAQMKVKQLHITAEFLHAEFDARWACEQGKVTSVHPQQGPTGQPGPCFEVDIPFKGGMSGGPVMTWDENAPYVRGFIMKGEERMDEGDQNPARFALAGMIWPLLLMPVDLPDREGKIFRERSLLDLEKEGVLIDKGRAHDHIKLTRGDDLKIVAADWE